MEDLGQDNGKFSKYSFISNEKIQNISSNKIFQEI